MQKKLVLLIKFWRFETKHYLASNNSCPFFDRHFCFTLTDRLHSKCSRNCNEKYPDAFDKNRRIFFENWQTEELLERKTCNCLVKLFFHLSYPWRLQLKFNGFCNFASFCSFAFLSSRNLRAYLFMFGNKTRFERKNFLCPVNCV